MSRHVTAFFGIIIGLIVIGLYGFRTYTKSFSPAGTTSLETSEGLKIEVDYSRPYHKGRKLFGYEDALVPFGQVWRTGANEATEIVINKDVEIYGQELPAGRYTLFSIPNEITWTIIFNKDIDQWGAFNYKEEEDALRVNAPAVVTSNDVEMFTIGLQQKGDGAEVKIQWGKTLVTLPMSLK